MRVDFSRLRFLVVEDSEPTRRLICAMLAGFGAPEIYEAQDGPGGYEGFQALCPDIVITDWEMPGSDGLALLRRIRDPDASPNPFTPVIMTTAYAERRRVLQAVEAGVSEYLVKPVTARALYDRILSVVADTKPFVRVGSYFGPDRRREHAPVPLVGERWR
jgi:two-component system chemotaxis response regulator CheY